ncbi:hypothetical protein SAZ11_54380 [Streptomyces sp. FXJ1.4098]|nr:hypothetical protein [Streptomyces sp. FXJ1.4098]
MAVLATLPQRLWHRTALDPRRVRLRASGPWAGSARMDWEFTEAPLAESAAEAPRGRRPVPVPVLEVADEWIAPWARFIGGEGPRWTEVAALLVSQGRSEAPAPRPERTRSPPAPRSASPASGCGPHRRPSRSPPGWPLSRSTFPSCTPFSAAPHLERARPIWLNSL